MDELIAEITGIKVPEDNDTRWVVFCFICGDVFGEPSKHAKDLKKTLREHRDLHKEETPE